MESAFGLIGKKCGMTSYFNKDGSVIPCTALHIDSQYIAGIKTKQRDGYNAVIVGSEIKREKLINKPQKEFFKKNNLPFLKNLKEFRFSNETNMSCFVIGDEFEIDFKTLLGSYIDVRSVSKGKGFQGVVKRYNFAGQEASHGHSLSHRSHGSTGQRQDPGKVFKNKKMAGHMGSTLNCIQSLKIINVLEEERMIFVSGSVAGFSGCNVEISTAIKKSSLLNSNSGVCFNGIKLIINS